ncbi:MAG TPA: hypothetical protein VGF45_20080 [Polyangia bacterium]
MQVPSKKFLAGLAPGVFALLAAFTPAKATACTCPLLTPAQYIANSHTIFEGTAVSRRQTSANGLEIDHYEFRVARHWKGTAHTTTVVQTSASSASCGRSFEIGRTYLLLGRLNSDGTLTDGLCSGTGLLEERQAYLPLLGEAMIPSAPPSSPTDAAPTTPSLSESTGCAISASGSGARPSALVFAGLAILTILAGARSASPGKRAPSREPNRS